MEKASLNFIYRRQVNVDTLIRFTTDEEFDFGVI